LPGGRLCSKKGHLVKKIDKHGTVDSKGREKTSKRGSAVWRSRANRWASTDPWILHEVTILPLAIPNREQ